MNALAAFSRYAQGHPGQDALVRGLGPQREALSFGQLEARSARLAAGLAQRGLKRGDRVLVFVPMSLDLYVILLACFRSGLSAVFLDAWSSAKRLDEVVTAAAPKAALLSLRATALLLLSPALRAVPRLQPVSGLLFPLDRLMAPAASAASLAKLPSLPSSQEAYVTFTTGSTGKPKGAARSHAFLEAQAKALSRSLYWRPGSIDLVVLPSFVLLNLSLGVTSVLPEMDPRKPDQADPARQLALMEAEAVESASGSPAYFERVAALAQKRGRKMPLKRLYVGGAAVLPAQAQLLCDACEGQVQVVYGSTEAEPIAHVPALDLVRAARQGWPGLLAGKPDQVALKILNPVEGPLRLGPQGWMALEARRGQPGEIIVSGAHVQRGYLGDPEGERRNKIKDGTKVWHRTGDAGYLGPQGQLCLLGRLSQRVARAGKTWWSLEAERRALQVPGVSFAAYFDHGGAQLCVEAPQAAPDLEAALRKVLAPYPVDGLKILPKLPRDPRHGSKVDLERLKKLL